MFRASTQCPALSCHHVLFGLSASELCVVPRAFVYLLKLAKYFLWRARNDHRFCDVRPGANPWMEVIKGRAKCHLCLFFKHFKSPCCQHYFQRQWGANTVISCSVRWFFLLPFLIVALLLEYLVSLTRWWLRVVFA